MSMQAIAYKTYGGPEVTELLTLPIPTPKPNEVLVRVSGGGLNPVDAYQRSGAFKLVSPYHLPVVAGNEFSGTITEVGSSVSGFTPGEKVIARVAKDKLGALGQYTAIEAQYVARAPKSIPLADSAGLPLAGLTALQVLDHLDVKAGDNLLITAGAGGVGLFAIQLAKLRGAHVSTTASSAGEALVKRMGADEVIDYKTTKLASLGQVFDKVFDAAGPDDAALKDVFASVKRGGHVVSIAGPLTPDAFDKFNLPGWRHFLVSSVLGWKSRTTRSNAHAAGVKYDYFFMLPNGKELQQLADLVDEGKLEIVINSRYPLAQYKEAFEQLESRRSKGKVIIQLEA